MSVFGIFVSIQTFIFPQISSSFNVLGSGLCGFQDLKSSVKRFVVTKGGMPLGVTRRQSRGMTILSSVAVVMV